MVEDSAFALTCEPQIRPITLQITPDTTARQRITFVCFIIMGGIKDNSRDDKNNPLSSGR